MAGWTVRSLQRDFVGSNSTGCTHRVGPTGMVELDIVAGEAAAGAALLWDVLTGRTHSVGCELEGGVIGYGSVWPHAGKRCMHIYMYVQLLRPGRAKQLRLRTTPLFFPKRKRRAASGGIRTGNILRARLDKPNL